MAKLSGVKVIDMTAGEVTKVAYEGAEYERVKHPIKKDDLILNVDDHEIDLTLGAFYKVISVDNLNDVQFLDDEDDERDRRDDDIDFVPFRKVSAQDPTIEARVDKLESDVAALKGEQGATTPKFKAGDKVRGKLTGYIYTLKSRCPEKDNPGDGLTWNTEEYSSDKWVGENQVELIEEKPLAVGDYAKVVPHNNDIGFGGRPGDIVIIRDKRVDRYKTKELSGGNYRGNPWVKTEGLVRATDEEVAEAKAAHFEVGDYIVPLPSAEKYWITNSDMRLGKVIDKMSAFIDIEIVAHKKEDEVGEEYTAVSAEHFRKATVEEIAEVKAAMKPKLTVGDYAKVVGRTYCGDIKTGTVVKITKEADEDGDYKIVLLDESNYDYAQVTSLEKVDADKAETINKWAKIGREVDEYKEGDIVSGPGLFGNFFAGEVECVGDVLEVRRFYGHVNTMSASKATLIAPVESRVDR